MTRSAWSGNPPHVFDSTREALVMVEIRDARLADCTAPATAHIRTWQAAYRGSCQPRAWMSSTPKRGQSRGPRPFPIHRRVSTAWSRWSRDESAASSRSALGRFSERYGCNFGPSPEYQSDLEDDGTQPAAVERVLSQIADQVRAGGSTCGGTRTT